MRTIIIDASIAIKWVVSENGTDDALALRQEAQLIAPELLVAECANILWKKTQRNQLSKAQALFAARLLQSADIELLPTRGLLEAATRLAIQLEHPAYDCFSLALAMENNCPFVTADERLLRKLEEVRDEDFRGIAISLATATASKAANP